MPVHQPLEAPHAPSAELALDHAANSFVSSIIWDMPFSKHTSNNEQHLSYSMSCEAMTAEQFACIACLIPFALHDDAASKL